MNWVSGFLRGLATVPGIVFAEIIAGLIVAAILASGAWALSPALSIMGGLTAYFLLLLFRFRIGEYYGAYDD
ncbi:MAG: hypothetical protein AB8B82_13520 [Roseovarius sp.]